MCLDGGPLIDEFKNLGHVWVWNQWHQNHDVTYKIRGKMLPGLRKKLVQKQMINEIVKFSPDLIYANTIVSSEVASMLKTVLNVSSILHIHEMEFSIGYVYKDFLNEKYLHAINKFIVVNQLIKNFLINSLKINNERVVKIPPFYQTNYTNPRNKKGNGSEFIVGLSGFGGWRKGLDILTAVIACLYYQKALNGIKFVWVGEVENSEREKINYELKNIDCTDVLSFTGSVKNTQDIYESFSVMLLLSKEDPFPIACLETANLEVPIICFDKSGGIPEFVEENAGFVVPFLDIQAVAAKILLLKNDENLRQELGRNAAEKAQSYQISKIAPQILDVIKTIV